MYVSLESPIAYPLEYDGTFTWGLGAADPTATSTLAENAAAGALLTAAAVTPPPANAILVVAAGIAKALAALGVGAGCGPTCVKATNLVNQAEPILQQNIANYFAQPAPRSASSQAAALAQFDAVWQGIVTACGAIPAPGGTQCVSDRQSGACKWKQTSTSSLLAYPGEPQAGACWNWFSGYRDPIANDPDVVADSVASTSSTASSASTVSSAVSSAVSSITSSPTTMLLMAAAAGLLLVGVMTK